MSAVAIAPGSVLSVFKHDKSGRSLSFHTVSEVGGCFKFNLQRTSTGFLKSHPRQWVDC